MKRIKGTTLALIGLFLGLSLGCGVVALKHYLVQEIVDALDDEVEAACDCKLVFDSFSLSLLKRQGRATNVRIVENGVPRLWFDEITTDVNIDEIREKRLYLENLTLSRGTADGIGPDSVMFRFIDQLTAPLPPEKQVADRWRAILNTLTVENTLLREPFSDSEILAANTSMSLVREGDKYRLKPRIGDLRYRSFEKGTRTVSQELMLGEVSAGVTIEDARTLFDSLTVGRNASRASIKMAVDTDHGDQCSGDASFDLAPDYIGLPNWLLGAVEGTASVGGTLGSPTFSGSLQGKPSAPLTLAFPHAEPVALDSFNADLMIDINHGDPVVQLSNILGSAPSSTLRGTSPLTFSDEGLRAGFAVELPEFTYGPFVLAKASAKAEIEPEGEDTVTKLSVRAQDLALQGTSLGPMALAITIKGDSVSVTADSSASNQGSLKWRGAIDVSGTEPLLSSGELKLENYRYLSGPPGSGNSQLSPIAVTTSLSLKGPLDLAKLRGEGETSVSFPSTPRGMALNGKAVLRDGVLSVNLPGSSYKGSADLRVDLAGTGGGKLTASLPGVPLSEMIQGGDCGSINASLDYSFSLDKPLEGSGAIAAEQIQVGCAPYVLTLPSRSSLPIVGGALKLNQLSLSGNESTLTLNGEVGIARGFDLSVNGGLYLSSLLPLLPSLDNLRGLLTTKLALKGPLADPSFHGTAALSSGEFGIHEPDLEAHKIAGNFVLNGKGISFESLTGSVNSGTFEMSGTVLPADIERSALTARLDQVTIEPMPDSSLTVSGDFALGTGKDKRQTLSGDLTIDFAEVRKEFNLNRIIVNAISGYFLPSRIKQKSSSSKPVDLDLDVKIHAPRNIFVVTPFFTAELNADILATRSVSEPALDGKMEILSGWVGLKGNRFDITSGSLTFKQGNLTPQLSISSEGSVRTPTGDTILVILEASGPLTSPRIVLSSDRALSQDEILLLLTSSRSLTGRTLANQFSGPIRDNDKFFFSKSTFGGIGAFFSSLSKIDVLSFEPAYNPWTGSIEPSVVAKKKLSSRADLVAESLLGTVQSSRAGAVYNLTPSLSVNAFVQNISTQRNNIVSSDLTYTILAEQSTFLEFEMSGLDEFSQDNILSAAHLAGGSRIKNTPDTLASIRRDIVRYMNEQGYLDASVEVQCLEGDTYCKRMSFAVHEGQPFTISEIVVDGDGLSPDFDRELRSNVEPGDPATTSTSNAVERDLVLALREQGYIAARVSPSYEPIPGTSHAKMLVTTDIREPISFVFKGNSVFSASDFLDSIDLFSRRRPFGNNTINLLLQNIEQMYQQKGYLFVQVSYTENRTNPERLVYEITINEEAPTKVRQLRVTGDSGFTVARIRELMDELGYGEQKDLLRPEFAIPADLDTLRDILTVVFQQEGYTDVSVSYKIEPTPDSDQLDITYTVTEGQPHTVSSITASGVPTSIKLPSPPPTPASYPRVNQFIEQIVSTLKDEGYVFPSVSSDAGVDDQSIEIFVEPGPLATIGSISYEGLDKLTREIAEGFVKIAPGQPYRMETVNGTKRALLRSGLFSRVEIVAADGDINGANEAIVIRLAERPLNTLEIGTGASSEFGLHLFGEATDKSLFLDGRSLSFRLDTYLNQFQLSSNNADSINQGFASLRYLDPEFLGSNYILTEEARYQRQTISTYEFDFDRLLFASYLFRQLHNGISFSGGHSLLLDDLFNVDPGAIIGPLDEGHVRLSFLSGVLKFDQRDDPLLPRSGYTVTLEPKLSMIGIGSEANYGTVVGTTTGIVPLKPLGDRFSLGLAASAGLSQPWGSTTEIPITQRFYLGGRTTVRGYDQNSLGPEGSDGAIIGGDTMLLAKGQFEYMLFDSFSTHLFYDAGNVWLRHVDLNLSDIKQGSGAGFQYLSPIGPIGMDLGTPLNPSSGDSRLLVTFSVGSVF